MKIPKPLPRCTCPVVDDEPLPEVPQVRRCKTCKSWTALDMSQEGDWEKVKKAFGL
jgi:hypothetical protein